MFLISKLIELYNRLVKGDPPELCETCGRPLPGKTIVNFDSKTHQIKEFKEHSLCSPNRTS